MNLNLFFFAALYFVQGAALAYVVNFQKPYLLVQGIDKTTMGIFTGLLLVPFILKVFLGLLSDRVPLGRFGSRRPYMVIGLLLFAASYASISQVEPGKHFFIFASLSFIASLGLALFDTCADGWAIDVASREDESRIQSSMVAGKSLGLILMSIGFGYIGLRLSFSWIFLCLAAFAVLMTVFVLRMPYKPRKMSKTLAHVGWSQWLKKEFIAFALFGIVYSIASFGTDGLLTLHLAESAHSVSALLIGTFGTARGIGALFGAGVYAMCAKHFGLKQSQILALVFLGGGCLLPLGTLPVGLAAGLWGACWAFQETAFVTLAMRLSRGPWAATFFAICMIFSNIGTSLGEAIAAPLVPRLGYATVFMIFAVISWGTLLFLPLMKRVLDKD
jgi:PAT family beta-lactamase induction signal transducer AmpG